MSFPYGDHEQTVIQKTIQENIPSLKAILNDNLDRAERIEQKLHAVVEKERARIGLPYRRQ